MHFNAGFMRRFFNHRLNELEVEKSRNIFLIQDIQTKKNLF
jgi:hypothetical protein